MPDLPPLYMCVRCDASFQSDEPIRFCNKCGASVKLVEGEILKKVLLIDDSKLTRTKITAILKSLGVKVTEAENGPEGLKTAETLQPDLIILDIEMPQMTGLEVLKILSDQDPPNEVPVVMLTGHADVDLVKQALSMGAKDYVLKDKSVLEIANRLKKYI